MATEAHSLHLASAMMNASLTPTRIASAASGSEEWEALDALLTEILAHRGFLRAAGPREPTGLDRIAADLTRVHAVLAVVASRCDSAGRRVETAVAASYRWALDVGALLADLEVASLDRVLTNAETEAFARRATTGYVVILEPAFDDAQRPSASAEDAALRWDLETVRAAVERTLVAIFDLA
jgi:hypothetical protein